MNLQETILKTDPGVHAITFSCLYNGQQVFFSGYLYIGNKSGSFSALLNCTSYSLGTTALTVTNRQIENSIAGGLGWERIIGNEIVKEFLKADSRIVPTHVYYIPTPHKTDDDDLMSISICDTSSQMVTVGIRGVDINVTMIYTILINKPKIKLIL